MFVSLQPAYVCVYSCRLHLQINLEPMNIDQTLEISNLSSIVAPASNLSEDALATLLAPANEVEAAYKSPVSK